MSEGEKMFQPSTEQGVSRIERAEYWSKLAGPGFENAYSIYQSWQDVVGKSVSADTLRRIEKIMQQEAFPSQLSGDEREELMNFKRQLIGLMVDNDIEEAKKAA